MHYKVHRGKMKCMFVVDFSAHCVYERLIEGMRWVFKEM